MLFGYIRCDRINIHLKPIGNRTFSSWLDSVEWLLTQIPFSSLVARKSLSLGGKSEENWL